ncbi:MAG: 16S rRNA (cytosine(1402)-N(4))-methyltransferase RsmH [Eubacteriales bacterium]|nr:16S rRNA (cytosine(1402)-N(4))-methyltransferase RsmH [Eubacteriales bacterium]
MSAEFQHIPVLLGEVLELLAPERGGTFIDGTLGGGGHAEAVLSRLPQSGRLIGIDRDWEAVHAAEHRLLAYGGRFTALHGNFFQMKALLGEIGISEANGILLDLGVSSHQLDTPERGFSYKYDAPLDMRMDKTAPLSARDVVNTYSQEELARVLWEYGEERFSRRIAERICRARAEKPVETTLELAEIARAAIPAKYRNEPQHPARRTFQAIRIEVNGELKEFDRAVEDACDLLQKGGRLCIITFHSLEDRIVKQAFRRFEHPCTCPPSAPVCICGKEPKAKILTKKPLTASEKEAAENSRSNCAKLRCIEKI